MSPAVISLFDHSGRFVAPWAAAGYVCYCAPGQHPPDPVASVAAFPPRPEQLKVRVN